MDNRIQAIRCRGCGRLRAHPRIERDRFCACGSVEFATTFPLPDEEQLALKLYGREIEEGNLWANLF